MLPFQSRVQFQKLRTDLTLERQMTSLMEREIAALSDELEYNSENWVRMWIDTAQTVHSDCGDITAQRGIDETGQLLWMVRHVDRKHGYHSPEADPVAAMEEAQIAWDRRRAVRKNWSEITALASDLRSGKRSMTVLISDAENSPLCAVGIRSFLTRIGMPNISRAPGRLVGLMMLIEPQVGFVIHEAAEREKRETTVTAQQVTATMRTARQMS
ncbi:hypothetical protein E4Z66_07725 [Aliishimia ponticola]|uniref:Uncharacterized protein n=1 Tax=Aliishimia ponticola TaxID=2499833 RepID=A0A4S4NBN2_9RHOB|nr:hypothetical protein [Aliishimia ponticola]THH36826.1 hypothetical protein E4Z66_07725 [Aliishimia ponticola]